VDGIGSGLCVVVGFGNSSVEFLCSADIELISKMDLLEIGSEDGRWMELAQDHVQLWTLVLAVFNMWVLLPESWLKCGD
jgi:hypothetical protein